MTAVVAPVDVVAKLSATLAIHHAPHLLPGVLACLAPSLQPQPAEEERRTVDVAAVVGLARLLFADGRPDLLTRVLLAVTPWLPAAQVPSAPPAAPLASTGLTVRQTEMLHLVSCGFTNGEIGKKLYLAEDTVKTRLAAIYRALGAKGRAHAVRLGIRTGVIELGTD